MTAPSVIIGILTGLLYLVATLWLRRRREVRHLRGLCRRCADHLISEYRDGIRDKETHLELYRDTQLAGWTPEGRER
jgi:hypothetical protein